MIDHDSRGMQVEDAMVAAEQVRMLYANLPIALTGMVVVSALSCAMFSNDVLRVWLVSWVMINMLFAVLLFWVRHQFYIHFDVNGSNALFWLMVYSMSVLCLGILWSVLPWLMLHYTFAMFNVFSLSMILTGIVAGSIGVHASHPVAFSCYAVPVIGSMAIRLAVEGAEFLYVVMLLSTFMLVMMSFSVNQYRMIARYIRQRFENTTLMHNLEIKTLEAEKANADKSRFLVATSHDLRQPLHALDLFLGTLDRMLTTPSHNRILQQAIQSSRSLGNLLNALLDVSRLDTGVVVPDRQPFRLQQITDEISSWYPDMQAGQRRIRVRVPDVVVDSDPVLLNRMIRNLVSNAVKHTEGNILVGTRRCGTMIRLEVHDQGRGVPIGEQEAIFSEFYQMNNPERDRRKGLGLGLAIVRRLSDLLNHPVRLTNKNGKGLCVSIVLPLSTLFAHHHPDSITTMDLTGQFVLAVDDEASIREGLRVLLRSWDCEVLTAGDIETALSIMRRDAYPSPDVLLMDYRLRGYETGLDAVHILRKHFNREIPAIIITGDTDGDIAGQCRDAGCQFMTKPLRHDALIAALTTACKT